MTRHEIDIEGLPEGWEPVRVGTPAEGDSILSPDGDIIPVCMEIHQYCRLCLIVRRKVRKYDHSKTDDDVLVRWKGRAGCHPKVTLADEAVGDIPPYWQPNIHGRCPVDGEACIVRVRYMSGDEREVAAHILDWSLSFHEGTVTAYQFIRLADGYKW